MNGWIDPELVRDFAAEETDAYRVCTRRHAWAERLGDDLLVSFQEKSAREELLAELPAWSDATGVRPMRVFGRFVPRHNAERQAPELISGDETITLQTSVKERGLRFGVDFAAGYSAGLFLDQRENRAFVRRTAPRALLNCFAYTCSFSVVAALGGGATTNIDLSKKSLGRGRENFALNALPTMHHRFLADDVLEALPRFARRGETFDMIILDPPTFSRSWRGKAFQVERDFEPLLIAAIEASQREARILLSTNCSTLDERALEVMARFCLKATRRAGSFHREPRPRDFPPDAGARTLWLTLR